MPARLMTCKGNHNPEPMFRYLGEFLFAIRSIYQCLASEQYVEAHHAQLLETIRSLDPFLEKHAAFEKTIDLMVKDDYTGYVMIEASSQPKDRVAALAAQVALFKNMVAIGQKKVG